MLKKDAPGSNFQTQRGKTAHRSPIIYSAGCEYKCPSQYFEIPTPQSQGWGEVKCAAWAPLFPRPPQRAICREGGHSPGRFTF